ncbi:nucleotidyltransferase [Micrococcus sp. NPDC078436]|uniref:nucleotidyltransferase n=1 Tax=Micrococcus sp. NPDC078436 TaxID=3154960 RepID=UPI00344C7FA3
MTEATAQSTLASIIKAMTPDEDARVAAASHRSSIEAWLESDLKIVRMRETGSWHHGTAISNSSDVDYFVTMPGLRPTKSWDALEQLRASLARGLPDCLVRIDRPAVRITYFDGTPAVEITPAYFRETDDYDIPDPSGTGWIRSNPAVHLDYVNKAQKATDGRTKSLIRLVKTWKAWNSVPLSSFYLEMRTAQYALSNTIIIYDWDLRDFFKGLTGDGLRDMNDPTNYGRRIVTGTSSLAESIMAKYAIEEAARLAALAKDASDADDHASAVAHYIRLFNVQA